MHVKRFVFVALTLVASRACADEQFIGPPTQEATQAETDLLAAARQIHGATSAAPVSVNLSALDALAFTATIDGKVYRFAGKKDAVAINVVDANGTLASTVKTDWRSEGDEFDLNRNFVKITRSGARFGGVIVVERVVYSLEPGLLIKTRLVPRSDMLPPPMETVGAKAARELEARQNPAEKR